MITDFDFDFDLLDPEWHSLARSLLTAGTYALEPSEDLNTAKGVIGSSALAIGQHGCRVVVFDERDPDWDAQQIIAVVAQGDRTAALFLNPDHPCAELRSAIDYALAALNSPQEHKTWEHKI